MGSLKLFLLAGIASLATVSGASAADLFLPPPPPVEVPQVVPVTFSGGFYLRGDVGAGFTQLRGSHSTFDDLQNNYGAAGQPNGFGYAGSSATDQAIIGGGFGYQFNHYFRADVTGEYRTGAKYNANEVAIGCNTPSGSCNDGYGADLSSAVLLLNGYVDVGTWYGMTPYIGAGVGGSINTISGLTDYNQNYYNQASGYAPNKTRTSFAYALMAGVSYSLTENVKVDLGYRYLDMGSFASNPISCTQLQGCGFERQNFKLASHDIRIGLRYMFADFAPAPQYAPQLPLIRKY